RRSTPCASTGRRYSQTEKQSARLAHGRRKARPAAGNTRPADSQGALAAPATRVGAVRASASGFEVRAADSAGLAVPCAAPPRATRMDQGGVGRVGQQSQ